MQKHVRRRQTSLSSLAAGWTETDEGSGFPVEDGNAPLALLLRMCPPTCLYAPLVPEGCSCGCSWRFGEEGVDVNTRVLSAVTSACRTSILGARQKKNGDKKFQKWWNLMMGEKSVTSTKHYLCPLLEQQPILRQKEFGRCWGILMGQEVNS